MSDDNNKYNGWTNYATWVTKLWMDNEQSSQEYWSERAEEIAREAEPGEYDWETRDEMAVRALAEELENEHDERAGELVGNASVFADLLGHAMGGINWREIANSLLFEILQDLAAEGS
jgi:hypothetical protein